MALEGLLIATTSTPVNEIGDSIRYRLLVRGELKLGRAIRGKQEEAQPG